MIGIGFNGYKLKDKKKTTEGALNIWETIVNYTHDMLDQVLCNRFEVMWAFAYFNRILLIGASNQAAISCESPINGINI